MSNDEAHSIDLGWKRHVAINDWTSKVDSKASIVLSLEAAISAGIAALSAREQPLGSLDGSTLWWYRLGVGLVVIGVATAAFVVRPRLGSRAAKESYPSNTIYFGHLRHWKPTELAEHLDHLSAEDETRMLALQLIAMADIAWTKHRLLQLSLTVFPFGVLLMAVLLASQ